MPDKICLIGAKDICAAVGENYREMTALVRDHGLPAFRSRKNGFWKALPEDLKDWLRQQQQEYAYNPDSRNPPCHPLHQPKQQSRRQQA